MGRGAQTVPTDSSNERQHRQQLAASLNALNSKVAALAISGGSSTAPANTILGNNTGVATTVLDLTGVQVAAMLPAFVGDAGAGGVLGSVPAPGAGTATAGAYLKANGTWTVPPAPVVPAAVYRVEVSEPAVTFQAGLTIAAHKFTKAVTFPANFGATTSGDVSGSSLLAATTSTVIVYLDQATAATPTTFTNVGTITFSSSAVGVFASAGGAAVGFAVGDVLRVRVSGTYAGTYDIGSVAGVSYVPPVGNAIAFNFNNPPPSGFFAVLAGNG